MKILLVPYNGFQLCIGDPRPGTDVYPALWDSSAALVCYRPEWRLAPGISFNFYIGSFEYLGRFEVI